MQAGAVQFSVESLPDGDCEIFRCGNLFAEFRNLFIQMPMIQRFNHFPVYQILEPLEIDDEAGTLVHLAGNCDLYDVVVPMAMRIIAFAKDALVLFRGKRGVVIEVRGGKLCPARQINHAYALESPRFIIRSVSRSPLLIRVAAAVFVAFFLTLSACDRGIKPELVGRSAPDFTVSDAERTVSLHDYKGKIVVLNFWASWCAPCIEELPSLLQMQKDLGDHVTVLAVATDQDVDQYKRFLRDHPMNVITVNDQAQSSSNEYGTTGWPETYIIDRKGIIRRKFIGPVEWTNPAIVEYLEKLRTES